MKKQLRRVSAVLVAAAVVVFGCVGCQNKGDAGQGSEGQGDAGQGAGKQQEAVKLVDTYQSQARVKYFTVAEDRDFYIVESYAVQLYSDNTYVCTINITEAQQKLANFEYGDVNVINPLAVTNYTRCGTYTLTEDESVGSFELELGEAERMTFSTNAGGGHYPIVPTNSVMYVDDEDEAAAAGYETEWYGKWDELKAIVGAEVTLTGDSATHMFDAGCMVFDYESPMFVTLLGLEVY